MGDKTNNVDRRVREKILQELKRGKDPIDIVVEYKVKPNEIEEIMKDISEFETLKEMDSKDDEITRIFDLPDELLVLFMLASAVTSIDIITTRICLSYDFTFEANPIMNAMIKIFGTEYALMANVITSLTLLIAITYLSSKHLRGNWMYVPLLSYSLLRLIPVSFNLKMLLQLP